MSPIKTATTTPATIRSIENGSISKGSDGGSDGELLGEGEGEGDGLGEGEGDGEG